MEAPQATASHTRRYPFVCMDITSNKFLNDIEGRSACSKCYKSRKFFCYTCYLPVDELVGSLPKVQLPIKIDIIKHEKEIDGKSTAIHAPILAPDDVQIYTYPNIPDYSVEDGVVLIYPSQASVTVAGLFDDNFQFNAPVEFDVETEKGHRKGTLLKGKLNYMEARERKTVNSLQNLPIKRAVFIDSTWNQSRSIYKDPKVRKIRTVVLQSRFSQFWRHQKGSPRWYLATIEAIHQFLVEFHTHAFGLDLNYHGLDNLEMDTSFMNNVSVKDALPDRDRLEQPYSGQYDNLLFFFTHMYDLIHQYYDHEQLKSYKRPFF